MYVFSTHTSVFCPNVTVMGQITMTHVIIICVYTCSYHVYNIFSTHVLVLTFIHVLYTDLSTLAATTFALSVCNVY